MLCNASKEGRAREKAREREEEPDGLGGPSHWSRLPRFGHDRRLFQIGPCLAQNVIEPGALISSNAAPGLVLLSSAPSKPTWSSLRLVQPTGDNGLAAEYKRCTRLQKVNHIQIKASSNNIRNPTLVSCH